MWKILNSGLQSVVETGASVVTLESGDFELTEATIIRIRAELFVSKVLATVNNHQWWAGVIMSNEDASGASELPSPQLDADADWLYYRSGFFKGNVVADAVDLHMVVDNKAMRKTQGSAWIMSVVFEQTDFTGAESINMGLSGRALWLLH